VLIARTAEVATLLLKETESEAAKCGLHFTRDKAKRLAHGSDQFGFRWGRSTLEPLYIVRRLRDLVVGRQGQGLHSVFLDWAKGFDKMELACLDTAVTRYGVPEDMRRMTRALAESPELVVAMSGGGSCDSRAQTTGIRSKLLRIVKKDIKPVESNLELTLNKYLAF